MHARRNPPTALTALTALAALSTLPAPLTAQAADTAKWSVENTMGPADTLRFETSEGTWMNLDVSPNGQWIVFDLLGDIYRLPIGGGQAERLRAGRAFEHLPRFSPDGSTIVYVSDKSGADNLWLMDADGGNPRQLTTLTETLPTNPMWMPDGEWIVAKRHVRSTRSLGGGELWLFHVRGGSGVRLKEKESFTSELNEPYPSADGRWVYYSHAGPFDYNKDPHAGIFQLSKIDRVTGDVVAVTRDQGGAVRPTVSPDGSRLAFVRRVGLQSVLFVRDLATGAERPVFDSLSRDQMETWVVHGAYPTFQWMPDGRDIVVSATGAILRVAVDSGDAIVIPFTAPVEQVVTEALHFQYRITDDPIRARMIRWPVLSPDGNTLAFQAVGWLWRMAWPGGTPERVTQRNGEPDVLEFAPSYSPDGRWLAYTTWSTDSLGRVMKVRSTGSDRPRVVVASPNQYSNPVFSPSGDRIAYVAGSGTVNRGEDLSNELYLTIEVVSADGGTPTEVVRIANRGPNSRMPRITWSTEGDRLFFHEARDGKTMLSSVRVDGTDLRHLVQNERAEEMVVSPDGNWVLFKELHNVYVAPLPRIGDEPVTLEAGSNGVKVVRLSTYGGDWLAWRPDSRSFTWVLGPALYAQTLAAAYDTTATADTTATDWVRGNAKVEARITEIQLTVPRNPPSGTVVLRGARVITMNGDEVHDRADIVVSGNRIQRICPDTCTDVPTLARVVPLPGKTVIPGLVDVHAHMGYGALDINPRRYWPYWANLAFGVTTTHDPSASTQFVFSEAELVDAGRVVGPRIFSTGFILYGAENANKAVVTSLADARAHLRRHKAVGGFSVKSYNQMRRDVRQWIIQAARDEQMLVVPEGGSMLQQNISQVIDGHTGIEHAIPVAPLRQDVVTLVARSRTGYTPTLVVGYGGLWGENYWYQVTDVYKNERLLKFVPREIVDARARRRLLAPLEEFWHFELARTAKAIVDAGGRVQLGAHGQLQGLGAHWELWMFVQGGMTPMEALRAATLWGAEYLGHGRDLGSIEQGKLADLVVLDANPLDDIFVTQQVHMVMKDGILYDADMNEIWPVEREVPELRRGPRRR